MRFLICPCVSELELISRSSKLPRDVTCLLTVRFRAGCFSLEPLLAKLLNRPLIGTEDGKLAVCLPLRPHKDCVAACAT